MHVRVFINFYFWVNLYPPLPLFPPSADVGSSTKRGKEGKGEKSGQQKRKEKGGGGGGGVWRLKGLIQAKPKAAGGGEGWGKNRRIKEEGEGIKKASSANPPPPLPRLGTTKLASRQWRNDSTRFRKDHILLKKGRSNLFEMNVEEHWLNPFLLCKPLLALREI